MKAPSNPPSSQPHAPEKQAPEVPGQKAPPTGNGDAGEAHSQQLYTNQDIRYRIASAGVAKPHTSRRLDLRPVLVVGIGGTGCLAVKHIKARVRAIARRQQVPFIIYVVIDTTLQDPTGEPLDDGEFVNIGHVDFNSIVRNIQSYAHLKSWFPHDRMRPMQLGLGAGGVRHIGRLCYFQWRESPRVLPLLTDRIAQLMNKNLAPDVRQVGPYADVRLDQSMGLDIHLIASGAGGTGSGILLDLAYDLRKIALDQTGSVKVIGHVLLPDAFEGKIPANLMAQAESNSHSLLSEINHFIEEGNWRVVYKGGEVAFEKQTPFDQIYLLGRRGLGGAVSERDQLIETIGATVASLALTPPGKRIKEDTENLHQTVLSARDSVASRRRPYGSYGIALGVALADEIQRGGALELQLRLLADIRGRTRDARRGIEARAAEFVSRQKFAERDLEQLLTDLPTFGSGSAFTDPEQANVYREHQHNPALKAQITGNRETWRKRLEMRLDDLTRESLRGELRSILRSGSDPASGLPRLGEVIDFASELLQHCRRISAWCDAQKRLLTEAAQTAVRTRTDLTAIKPPPPDWADQFARAVRDEDRKTVYTPFYDDLREECGKLERQLENALLRDCQILDECLARAQQDIEGRRKDVQRLPSYTLRVVSSEEVLSKLFKELNDHALNFREHLLEILRVGPGARGVTETRKAVMDCLINLAEAAVAESLDKYKMDGFLDLDRILPDLAADDPDRLKRQLKYMYDHAQPALRCVELLPKEEPVYMGRVGTDVVGPVVEMLQNLEQGIQAEPDDPTDLLLMRFVHGVPLWALQGVDRWERSAVEVQTAQQMKHNFLDPNWQRQIKPFNPLAAERREQVKLFTCFLLTNRLVWDGVGFQLDQTRFPQGQITTRAAAFEEFVKCLKDGRLPRTDALRAVEQHLPAIGPARIQRLEQHYQTVEAEHDRLLQRVEHLPLAIARDNAGILREEKRVLADEIAEIKLASPSTVGA